MSYFLIIYKRLSEDLFVKLINIFLKMINNTNFSNTMYCIVNFDFLNSVAGDVART